MTTRGSEESKEKKVKNYEKRVRGSMTNDHYIFNIQNIVNKVCVAGLPQELMVHHIGLDLLS
jgi:hypothetical protein